MTKVFLCDVIVTRDLFRFRSFSSVCQDVANKGRANRAATIVIDASIAGQVRVNTYVKPRVITQGITREREEYNECDGAGGKVSVKATLLIRLLTCLNRRRIASCFSATACFVYRIRTNEMAIRVEVLSRAFLAIGTREDVGDDSLITSKDDRLMILVVDNSSRFFPPIDVSRFQCSYVYVGVNVYVYFKELRPLICYEIVGAFVGRFATLFAIRYKARISDYVEGASTNARDSFDPSCHSFLNDSRGRSVHNAQTMGEDNNNVLCRHGVLSVNEVGNARCVYFNVVRVNNVDSHANSRATKDSQCAVGGGGQFVKYVR